MQSRWRLLSKGPAWVVRTAQPAWGGPGPTQLQADSGTGIPIPCEGLANSPGTRKHNPTAPMAFLGPWTPCSCLFPWTSSGLKAGVGPAWPSISHPGLTGTDPGPRQSWKEQSLIASEQKPAVHANALSPPQSIFHPVNRVRSATLAIIKPIISLFFCK